MHVHIPCGRAARHSPASQPESQPCEAGRVLSECCHCAPERHQRRHDLRAFAVKELAHGRPLRACTIRAPYVMAQHATAAARGACAGC